MTATIQIPHDGTGTHTLVIAIPIEDTLLDQDDLTDRLIAHATNLIRQTLRTDPIIPDRRHAEAVATDLDIDLHRLFSDDITREVAHARHELCRRLHDEQGWSLNRIGRILSRDHTTVLHGVRQARRRLACETDGCDRPSMARGRWCHPCWRTNTVDRRTAA